jgi:hypothetical protein
MTIYLEEVSKPLRNHYTGKENSRDNVAFELVQSRVHLAIAKRFRALSNGLEQ